MSANSNQTIFVTGANGYIGLHIVKTALERGYKVRAAARSESSLSKVKSTFAFHAAQLSTAVVADLTDPASYASALDGSITSVVHTASPFVLDPHDLRADVLDPAINGSVAVLEAVARYAPRVTRVVVTSSLAAMADITLGLRPGYEYTAADWNPMTYEQAAETSPVPAYVASKALAEKAMWDWMSAHPDSHFSLTAVNPAWVYGPVVGTPDLAHLNASLKLLWGLVGAEAVPPTDFPAFVDVRDLAAAHVNALEKGAAEGHRFPAAIHSDYQTVVDLAREEFPELRARLPEGRPGFGLTEPAYTVDSKAVEEVLGVGYTPLRTTVRDTFKQFLETEKATVAAA